VDWALPDSADVIAQRLRRFHRIAVAAPAYVERHGRPKMPAQLAGHECLRQLSRGSECSRWQFERNGDEQTAFVAEELRRRRLFRLLDGWQSPELSIWALYRTELRASPKLRAFLAAVSD
jgi:DNA-binding transcriptional LysR family regulator